MFDTAHPAWTPLGLSGGGAMFAPAISPHDSKVLMINCDMSGVYISRDGGDNWTLISRSQLQGNIRCEPLFHPLDPKIIYAAHGWAGRLRRSEDAGLTWKNWGNLPEGLEGLDLDPSEPENMIAGVQEDAYLSRDGGLNWRPIEELHGAYASAFMFPGGPWYVAGSNGIWLSHDKGAHWAQLREKNGPSLNLCGGQAGGQRELYLLAETAMDHEFLLGGHFASDNEGRSWRPMTQGLNADSKAADEWAEGSFAKYNFLLTARTDPKVVYTSSSSTGYWPPHFATVYRSADAGHSWAPVLYADPRFEKFNVDQDYRSAALGQNYNNPPLGLAVSPTNPEAVLFVDDMKAYVTQDGGQHWKAAHTRPAKPLNMRKVQGDRLTDPDAAWACNGLVVTSAWDYAIDPHDPSRHYIPYTDILFARSTDKGASWRWGIENLPWHNTCYQLAFDPEIPGKMWGAFSDVHDIPNGNIILGRHSDQGGGGVGLSLNYGENWTASSSGLPEAPLRSMVVDSRSPKDHRRLFAASFGQGIFRSEDGGFSWRKTGGRGLGAPGINMRVCGLNLHPDGALDVLVTGLKKDGHFVREGPGLFRSRDQGESWTLLNKGRPWRWPKSFAVDPKDSRVIYVGAMDIRQYMEPAVESKESREEGGLWRTLDGGLTWTRVLRQGGGHFGASINPKNGWVYATLCEDEEGPPLWLSKDRGETWRPFEDFPFGNAMKVTFDPLAPETIIVSTFGASCWRGPAEP